MERPTKEELLLYLNQVLVGGDPMTFTRCKRGHRLYPGERETGICLRCAQENYAFVRGRSETTKGAAG